MTFYAKWIDNIYISLFDGKNFFFLITNSSFLFIYLIVKKRGFESWTALLKILKYQFSYENSSHKGFKYIIILISTKAYALFFCNKSRHNHHIIPNIIPENST